MTVHRLLLCLSSTYIKYRHKSTVLFILSQLNFQKKWVVLDFLTQNRFTVPVRSPDLTEKGDAVESGDPTATKNGVRNRYHRLSLTCENPSG